MMQFPKTEQIIQKARESRHYLEDAGRQLIRELQEVRKVYAMVSLNMRDEPAVVTETIAKIEALQQQAIVIHAQCAARHAYFSFLRKNVTYEQAANEWDRPEDNVYTDPRFADHAPPIDLDLIVSIFEDMQTIPDADEIDPGASIWDAD